MFVVDIEAFKNHIGNDLSFTDWTNQNEFKLEFNLISLLSLQIDSLIKHETFS